MENIKTISYSQFSQWIECPYRWFLSYVKKLRIRSESINSLFGTSMHEVIQEFLRVMYTKSLRDARELNLDKMLVERMKENYIKSTKENKIMDITIDEMVEFSNDGSEILTWFSSNVTDYFPKKDYELIGIEVSLDYPLQDGVKLSGYLDVVIRDKILNRIKIYDIKTSGQGWNKYQKKDKKKLMQLVIYKRFYAAQFNIDPADIDVEFIILKRKLWERVDFPQKRVQRVTPASGSVTMNDILRQLKMFVTSCFTETGDYRTDVEYEKRPSAKTCKYCEYADHKEICDRRKKHGRKQ